MNKFTKARLAVLGAGVAASNVVLAAVPAAVTTAIADAQTDGVTVATAMLVMAAAFLGFAIIRSQMRR